MKAVLTIEIEYSEEGFDPLLARRVLLHAAQHLAENGLLSDETDMEVETWGAVVELERA